MFTFKKQVWSKGDPQYELEIGMLQRLFEEFVDAMYEKTEV